MHGGFWILILCMWTIPNTWNIALSLRRTFWRNPSSALILASMATANVVWCGQSSGWRDYSNWILCVYSLRFLRRTLDSRTQEVHLPVSIANELNRTWDKCIMHTCTVHLVCALQPFHHSTLSISINFQNHSWIVGRDDCSLPYWVRMLCCTCVSVHVLINQDTHCAFSWGVNISFTVRFH